MERVGLVVAVKGDTAVVNLQRHTACGQCGHCAVFFGQPEHRFEVLNPIRAAVGQRVVVETDDRQVIKISFLLYLVPLAALVGGIFSWLHFSPSLGFTGNQELPAVGIGFGLMFLVYCCIRLFDRRVRDNHRYKAVIIALAPDSE